MRIIYIFFILTFFYGSTLYAAVENLIEKLNLSRPQVKKLRDQHQEHTRTVESLKHKITKHEQALKEELSSAEPKKEKIKQLTQSVNSLRDELLESKVDAIMEMRRVMTKDQLVKMEKINDKPKKAEKKAPKLHTRKEKKANQTGIK